MAAESRRSNPSLEEVLFNEGYRFDFFQAVRLLELIYPNRKPVGRRAAPADEIVRFRSHLSLEFPPSEIREIERDPGDERPPSMTTAFMGLAGSLGVLPRHYTELLLERARRGDFALRDFLDIFNHRLISLFHRASEKYRFHFDYGRVRSPLADSDDFTAHVFDLIGMGTNGLRGRLGFKDEALLLYAGLIGKHPRPAGAIGNILSDYFALPVSVIQFIGGWLEVTEENQTHLGPGEVNNALGVSAIAGSRVWDQQSRFRLRIGPLTYPQLDKFLPSGDTFHHFVEFARYCSGQEFDFEVQLVLKAAEVPQWRLGDRHAQLGFTTWLKTGEFTCDDDQVVFSGGLTSIGALQQ
jgi:type VI secretion system protein ImpH